MSIENNDVDLVYITENQIRNMFDKFKEFIITRNSPEYKKLIRDHIEVTFNVVFYFFDNEITHDQHIITLREK